MTASRKLIFTRTSFGNLKAGEEFYFKPRAGMWLDKVKLNEDGYNAKTQDGVMLYVDDDKIVWYVADVEV